ncbi:MAG: hypothetical protein JXQ30_08700 [Spirochaetes bacterium]|nr:hypothetical protein [Spirochaetota bacterium]
MAVEDNEARVPYDCDGSQKDFPFSFSVYDKEDLKVYHRYIESGDIKEKPLVEGEYTISSAYSHYRNGGVVHTVEAYPSPDKIILLNDPVLKQTADYEYGDGLPSQEHENTIDRAYIALQKFRESLDRVLTLMVTSSFKGLTLPDPVANMLLSWKEDLSGLKNVTGANIGDLTVSEWIKNNLLDDGNAAAARSTLGLGLLSQFDLMRIYLSSTQSAGSTTLVKLELDTAALDLNSKFDTENYKFIPGVNGYYGFILHVHTVGLDAGEYLRAEIRKNSTTIIGYMKASSGCTGCCVNSDAFALNYLTSTDEISFHVYHNHASAINIAGGNEYQTNVIIVQFPIIL